MGRCTRVLPYIAAIGFLVAAVLPTWAQTTTGANQTYVVANTDGTGVNIRSTPGGSDVGSWPEGSRMIEIGAARQANGRNWRNVRAPDNTTGWVAADFLVLDGGSGSSSPAAGGNPNELVVGKTEGQNAVLRDVPGGLQIGSYPEGSIMAVVTNEVRSADSRDWRNVRGPDGKTGWMAAVLLSGSGGTIASGSHSQPSATSAVIGSGPYSITTDMRARALAARALAKPIAGQRRSATPTSAATRTPTPTPR